MYLSVWTYITLLDQPKSWGLFQSNYKFTAAASFQSAKEEWRWEEREFSAFQDALWNADVQSAISVKHHFVCTGHND